MMKFFARMVCLMALLLPCSCIQEEPTEVKGELVVGSMLPDFAVTMNDGTVVTGEQLRRTPSVVMFFHTGCPDCQQALPRVEQLFTTYASQGVAFAIISREDDDASVSAYWKEQGFTMLYSAQTDRKVYELFAYERVPRIYVSARGGTIRNIFTDDPVPTLDELFEAIRALGF